MASWAEIVAAGSSSAAFGAEDRVSEEEVAAAEGLLQDGVLHLSNVLAHRRLEIWPVSLLSHRLWL